jgi:hemerythrin
VVLRARHEPHRPDRHSPGGDAAQPHLAALLQRLATHTREHFARDYQAMQRTGFPPYPMHHAEHERVLVELCAVVARYQADGDAVALRQYLGHDVPTWFLAHIQTMDFVTARWVSTHEG